MYLLDEPGSYLHANAQTRLCQKLRALAGGTIVIYCTHSHHLLEPQIIPIGNVLIAQKSSLGEITAAPIAEHSDDSSSRRLAFQPIYEALQVAPTSYEWKGKRIVVVEGIYDFFAYHMWRPHEDYVVVPAVGADSIRYIISLLIATGGDYRALWDNDGAGQLGFEKAAEHFGEEEATRRFRLLPIPGESNARTRILQHLFQGDDIRRWRTELGLPDNTAFKKVLLTLYYSADRERLVAGTSEGTREAFKALFESLW